jgi:hypothetical protein
MDRRELVIRCLLVTGTITLAGCSGSGAAEHSYKLAPESILPPDIAGACPDIREAYRFAILNWETLRQHPVLLRLRFGGSHEQRFMLFQRHLDSGKSGLRSNEPCVRHLHRHHA